MNTSKRDTLTFLYQLWYLSWSVKCDTDYFIKFLVITSMLSAFKAKERKSIKVKRTKKKDKMSLIKWGNAHA